MDQTPKPSAAPSGALLEIERLTTALTEAFASAENEFRGGKLDMTIYSHISKGLKQKVDGFFSAYP